MRSSILSFFLFLGGIVLVSCGGSHSGHTGHTGHGKTQEPMTYLDSLYASIWQAHDSVMPKMGKVRKAQLSASRLLDSLSLVERKAGKPLSAEFTAWQESLQALIYDLNRAQQGMDNWMEEFNIDSAEQKGSGRRRYLEEEKVRVDRVKESVFSSLSKSDSLFAAIK
ncbi:MAG: hypothetical protein FJX92_07625 [Bacteroidetes bacterium]|nr:hypothetical protein [Bacteroidota bacterium]